MTISFTLPAATIAAALITLAGTGTAHAEFRFTTTPGSACKLDGPPTTRTLKAIESRMQGTSNRDVDNAINIVCPISRTQTNLSNIGISIDGKVNPGRSVSCSVQSISASGEVLESKPFIQVGPSSGSAARLFTQNFTFFINELSQTDYLSMQCNMPANSGARIFGIRTMEEL